MWDLPGPRIKRVSPAMAGGFLTTEPLGKPFPLTLETHLIWVFAPSVPPDLFFFLSQLTNDFCIAKSRSNFSFSVDHFPYLKTLSSLAVTNV